MDDLNSFEEEGYRLMEPLCSDGWGELYRAVYVPHGRDVLFRRFAEGFTGAGAWRLAEAEIQAWARIDHPGILQPLDWGNPDAGPFLATEMPEGDMLGSLVRATGPGDGVEADEALAGLAAAIEAARVFGVLHLGLGLTNVWVAPGGAVRVSEFGLWYVGSEFPDLAAPADLFTAPEQGPGARPGAQADVYALAVLYVAMRSGLEAAEAASAGEPPELGGAPRSIAEAVTRALSADPAARPHCAAELVGPGDPHARDAEPGECAAGLRDCPVCRLKEEIALERLDGRGRMAARLERFATTGRGPVDLPGDPAARCPEEARRTGTPGPASLLPWMIIAALVLATLAVWWMAFR